jgi:prepilin-type N-terminal cleavage/methylation domain-containing protein
MRDRGFTLVETLVAMVLLGVGLLALTKMSVVNVQANLRSKELNEGVIAATRKMEDLRQYATAVQGTKSLYGFDYLISTNPTYGSVVDPPGTSTNVVVSGLLSGSTGGVARTTTGGATYEVMTLGAGGAYVGSDTFGVSPNPVITRNWTVRPITINGATDFAELTVEATWTDRTGNHRVFDSSMAYRRK